VNTFIRGIDRLATCQLPAAVIMCTNRLSALDPAVKRRAAEILAFERPSATQRHAVLDGALHALGLSAKQIKELVAATGNEKGQYGFTFSDLTQRLLPAIVLDAYPSHGVDPARALEIARQMQPTPPFEENRS
jgi:AAA+ superfamily predicted ATPase